MSGNSDGLGISSLQPLKKGQVAKYAILGKLYTVKVIAVKKQVYEEYVIQQTAADGMPLGDSTRRVMRAELFDDSTSELPVQAANDFGSIATSCATLSTGEIHAIKKARLG